MGNGTQWLLLRGWARQTEEQRSQLRLLFRLNGRLARAYQLVEELRAVLRAPDGKGLAKLRFINRCPSRFPQPHSRRTAGISRAARALISFALTRTPNAPGTWKARSEIQV